MESEGLLKEAFGLTAYESKVYLALLGRETSPADIAKASGVPQSRTYDTLRSLVQKGFVTEAGGSYRPVKPSAALAARMARFSSDFASLQASREEARRKVVAETRSMANEEGGGREPEMLKGMASVAGAFVEVLQASGDVILVVRKGMKAGAEFLARIDSSGRSRARIRVLLPTTTRLSREEAEGLKRLGIQVRRSPVAILDMMVAESGDVLIGVPARGSDEPFEAVAVRLKDHSFSAALQAALEKAWAAARVAK